MNRSRFLDNPWLQLALLFGCWVYVIALHFSNDGMWFQGDSPRHALNGVFFRDLIREGLSDPVQFTKSYYARYPAITPSRYPPLFYLMEAAAVEVFGVSSRVEKGIAQTMGLITGIYLLVALRRWISPTAGIAAGLLFLTPGMFTWTNAVMLNTPALCCAVASVFHIRLGLELAETAGSNTTANPAASKQIALGMILAILSILFHPTIGYILLIGPAWIILSKKYYLFRDWRVISIGTLVATGLLGLLAVVMVVSPEQLNQADYKFDRLISIPSLTFYFRTLPKLTEWWAICFGGLGLLCGLAYRGFRADIARVLVAFLIAFATLAPIWAKDPRYILLACPTAIWLAAYYIHATATFLRSKWNATNSELAILVGLASLFGFAGLMTWNKSLPKVNSIEQVVEFVEQIAPDEPIIYDGRFDGTFGYYLRVRDPKFQRQMVLAKSLLLPVNPLAPTKKPIAAADLLSQSGCRWLVLETPKSRTPKSLERILQQTVELPGFELVKSFKLPIKDIEKVDVYRIRGTQEVNGEEQPVIHSIPVSIQGTLYHPIEPSPRRVTAK